MDDYREPEIAEKHTYEFTAVGRVRLSPEKNQARQNPAQKGPVPS